MSGLLKPVFFRVEDKLANLAESYRPADARVETRVLQGAASQFFGGLAEGF